MLEGRIFANCRATVYS